MDHDRVLKLEIFSLEHLQWPRRAIVPAGRAGQRGDLVRFLAIGDFRMATDRGVEVFVGVAEIVRVACARRRVVRTAHGGLRRVHLVGCRLRYCVLLRVLLARHLE